MVQEEEDFVHRAYSLADPELPTATDRSVAGQLVFTTDHKDRPCEARVIATPWGHKGKLKWSNVSDFSDMPTIWIKHSDSTDPDLGRWVGICGIWSERTPEQREEDNLYYRAIPRYPSLSEDRWHDIKYMERGKTANGYGWLDNAKRRFSLYQRLTKSWPEFIAWWLAKRAGVKQLALERIEPGRFWP